MDRRAEIEAAIDEDPDDARAYEVYGDWLQEHDDPRGELIALQQAAEHDPSLAETARACFERQLPSLGGYTTCEFTWRHGFVRRATIGVSDARGAAFVRDLLDHPSGRFIVDLSLWPARSSSSALEAALGSLVERPRTALRSLSVVARGIELAAITPLLEDRFPRLEKLGILGSSFADPLLAALCASPLLPHLRELDLAGGRLTDRGIAALGTLGSALAHLDILDLRLNALTPAGAHAATRLARNVNVTGQVAGRDT